MAASWRKRVSRTECLWALVGFLGLTFAFVLWMEARHPEWTDREYAVRRALLLNRVAEQPERPVCAVLGSSRVGAGFVPEAMGLLFDDKGRQITVFNFSHTGSGPRLNLVQVQRLLDDGVKPRWILFELTTPFLDFERVIFSEFSFRDVRTLMPYIEENRDVRQPIIYRFEAVNRYRHGPVQEFAPEFASNKRVTLRPFGGDDGWERPQTPLTESKLKNLQETIRSQYEHVMVHWRVDPNLDEVLRGTLRLCRDNGIQPAIILFPESSTFRSWYGPGAEERVLKYLGELRAEFGIAIFDMRRTMPDNMFIDPHHLTEDGSLLFTRRLEKEVFKAMFGHP